MKIPFYSKIAFKFILTSTLITALLTLLLCRWFLYHEKNELIEKLEIDGRQLLSYFKAPAINILLYREMGIETGSLDSLIEGIVANRDYPTTYAYITDQRGVVIAHNLLEESGMLDADTLSAEALKQDTFVSRITNDRDGRVVLLEIAMPLRSGSKSWGSMQAGFSAAEMQKQLAGYRSQIVIFSAIFFLLGSVIFYIVGLRMSRPLLRLSEAMSEVSPQQLELDLQEEQRRDEIGILYRGFTDIMQSLDQSENERRKAAQLLIQSEKLATAGKLVAGVSHEVNNPLAALSSCIYNLENISNCEEEQDILIMKQAVQRIQNIVGQLLDFSRAESLSFSTIQSDVFIAEAALFSRMAIKQSECRLQANDACIPPVSIVIDKGKINQVILNLVMNAADTSPPQGCITMNAYLDDDFYCIAITDLGEGISEADKEKIFELFYTTKAPGAGTGMGLAISSDIVEMHAGTIQFTSVPGETTFTIKIPRVQDYL